MIKRNKTMWIQFNIVWHNIDTNMAFYFDIDSIEQKFLHFLRRRFDLKKKKKMIHLFQQWNIVIYKK